MAWLDLAAHGRLANRPPQKPRKDPALIDAGAGAEGDGVCRDVGMHEQRQAGQAAALERDGSDARAAGATSPSAAKSVSATSRSASCAGSHAPMRYTRSTRMSPKRASAAAAGDVQRHLRQSEARHHGLHDRRRRCRQPRNRPAASRCRDAPPARPVARGAAMSTLTMIAEKTASLRALA